MNWKEKKPMKKKTLVMGSFSVTSCAWADFFFSFFLKFVRPFILRKKGNASLAGPISG